ncbi:MAG TPA: Na/Pi cotransporter family protein [Flavobacteriales bacterium]|nr:Na/Pi cotransporter family protein [Flavobacteriales bacterium]HIA10893.1 Na/Pi cotransporter family protein [Flavobacteriales bacterium]
MNFSLLDFLELLGALGFFIYGMKVMSEGIQKVAGSKMRQILSVMTSNRFLGVFTGFLITGLLQSSSATTVMVVSFVNAGLLTLVESVGVVMGANIGTTITAWLISIFGFKVKIAAVALPIIAIGFPLMFSNRGNLKSWAEVIIGFALLFLGLNALKESVPDLRENPEVLEFLSGYASMGMLSLLTFIGVGTILTLVVQSSSAAMALTLVMCYEGWIPFEMAAAMVLGENIGTTITANLAAMIGNVHAKRAARAHFIFNVFGVVWMFFIFRFFLSGIDSFMLNNYGVSPLNREDFTSIPIALSLFHTSFNIINVLLLIGFTPIIAKVAERMVPSRGDVDEETKLEYIGGGILATPELSILEAKKEIRKFGKITDRMFGFVGELIENEDRKIFDEAMGRIQKYEDITDKMEIEIAEYLTRVAQGELSEETSVRIRSMISMINDMERIGDICYQMSKTLERKNDQNAQFSSEQDEGLVRIMKVVNEGFETMNNNIDEGFGQVNIRQAELHEVTINETRDKLRTEHLMRVAKSEHSFESGLFYSDLFMSCEKIGDHIFNINEAIVGLK